MAGSKPVGNRVQTSPALSHLLRAGQRYWSRLGNQMAAAMAFFSVLAMVPVLMFVFSGLGFTLTVIRPDLLGEVQIFIVDHVKAGPVQDQVLVLLSAYMSDWRRIGVLAAVFGLVIGAAWVANLKGVIRGMTRPNFDEVHFKHNPVVEQLINLGLMLVMVVLMIVTFAANVIGTQLSGWIVHLIGVDNPEVAAFLVGTASFALSLLTAILLFYLMYRYFPVDAPSHTPLIRGSIGAGTCFVALQVGASLVTGLFSLGRAAQLFGPVIVAMLVINLFATVVLFWAAWIATWDQPALSAFLSPGDSILLRGDDEEPTETF